GDLGRERDVLRPDGGEIDRNVRPQRMNDQLERLAQPRPRSRRDVVMFAVGFQRPLALEDFADDLAVLSRARGRLPVRDAVPTLDYLRPRSADAEQHTPSG